MPGDPSVSIPSTEARPAPPRIAWHLIQSAGSAPRALRPFRRPCPDDPAGAELPGRPDLRVELEPVGEHHGVGNVIGGLVRFALADVPGVGRRVGSCAEDLIELVVLADGLVAVADELEIDCIDVAPEDLGG